MAGGRIKGITVEIGGDASNLRSAAEDGRTEDVFAVRITTRSAACPGTSVPASRRLLRVASRLDG